MFVLLLLQMLLFDGIGVLVDVVFDVVAGVLVDVVAGVFIVVFDVVVAAADIAVVTFLVTFEHRSEK